MNLIDAEKGGYREYFGPCTESEEWMLKNAIHDINTHGKDVEYVVVNLMGEGKMIMTRQKGILDAEPVHTPEA